MMLFPFGKYEGGFGFFVEDPMVSRTGVCVLSHRGRFHVVRAVRDGSGVVFSPVARFSQRSFALERARALWAAGMEGEV